MISPSFSGTLFFNCSRDELITNRIEWKEVDESLLEEYSCCREFLCSTQGRV
jgi:hypothetical protein